MALIFPNVYRLGASNLGFQLIYDLVNRNPHIVCERFFAPEKEGEPLSLESRRPLRDFPVILYSISFEADFLSLLAMLAQGGVTLLAEERNPPVPGAAAGMPLVIGGGVATSINPEPLAPYTDMFVIGEAEPVLPELLDYLLAHFEGERREALLWDMASRFQGCYVPRFYVVDYTADGLVASISAPEGLPARIKKVTLADTEVAGYSRFLSPQAEFADLYLAELGRGCSRGCRFCAAGFVYRPPRLWRADAILRALEKRPEGVDRVGLLGMEMARPAELHTIAEYLLEKGCALSFSSLRADALSPALIRLLSESGLKTAAIAPDGASERLRRVINKGITEDDVLRAAEVLAEAGIANLKLYFMIGLPTETGEDLEEMVALVLKVKESLLAVGRPKGRLANLTLSINSFVPKPWTPFQFQPFAPLTELKKTIKFLRRRLGREPNVRIMADQPGKAFWQAVLARGDRRVGLALRSLLSSEKNWQQVFRQQGLEPEFYAMRQRRRDELFPWEIIDHGIKRQYLWSEYQRALSGKTTPRCDVERCRRCGVCND